MKPIVKWAGGKFKLCPLYKDLGLIPKKFDRYFEPFLGGAAMFLYLEPRSAVLSDLNAELINLYMEVKQSPEELITLLKEHKQKYDGHKNPEDYYYDIRDNPKDTNDSNYRAARTIFLNKTCFNGLYRVNKSGHFNVPWGKYKRAPNFEYDNIRAVSKRLADAELHIRDYRAVLDYIKKGDFVYLDPPYNRLSDSSGFTSYTQNGFNGNEQKQLASVFKELKEIGVKVLLSNSKTDLIYELYEEEYHIEEISALRSISCKGDGRGKITELAITSFKPIGTKMGQNKLKVD